MALALWAVDWFATRHHHIQRYNQRCLPHQRLNVQVPLTNENQLSVAIPVQEKTTLSHSDVHSAVVSAVERCGQWQLLLVLLVAPRE